MAAALTIVALIIIQVAPTISVPAFEKTISTFEECVAARNIVRESFPRQCVTADGRVFIEGMPPPQNDLYEPPPPPPPPIDFGLQANGCAVAGCSGQLCVSADEAGDIVTTCEYRAEYGCYSEAVCEPQSDGQCGWTESAELNSCLANPPGMETETYLEVM